MKFVSLTVIKIDGKSTQPKVMAFANISVIIPEPTENGTFFKYRDSDDKEKLYMKTYEVSEDFATVIRLLSDVQLSEIEKLSELVSLQQNKDSNIYATALAGDIILNMNPNEINQVATSDGWSQEIIIELLDSKGNLHNWYSGKGEALIRNTSIASSASIDTKNPQFLNGRAKVIVRGDKVSAWVSGEDATLIISDLTILGYTIIGSKSLITIT